MQGLYRGAVRLAHRLPVLRGAAAESIAGRRAATARWRAWAARDRTDAQLVWFHAASVGESQAAAPIMMRLRAAAHPVQLILTYSSTSMARWPGTWPADRTDYVPLDEPGPLAAVFDALRPDALCFSRGDLWPELVATARARSVPVAVVGGTVRPGSRRHRWPGRVVLREMHRSLTYVGAVSAADRERWIAAGVPADRVAVTGDPRHDWILEREADLAYARALAAWRREGPVLVAGSVERKDIAPLAGALTRAKRSTPGLRVLAAPHALPLGDAIMAGFRSARLDAAVWRGLPQAAPDAAILLMATMGSLADVYVVGDIAYVGGGFRPRGLHSVAEPAAYGIPVVAGSAGAEDPDLSRMVAAEGALVVGHRGDADSMSRAFARWLGDPGERRRAGARARSCLDAGAAAREAETLWRLILDECPQNAPFAH